MKEKKNEFTILIAEDEEFNLIYILEVLKTDNYQTILARNGKEALDKFKENTDIDLIVMDIKMPVMDGYEAVEKIREINNEIPIIAQTAYAMKEDEEKALQSGFNEYLSKPMKAIDLKEAIERLLLPKH